jgi:hypothetical protein
MKSIWLYFRRFSALTLSDYALLLEALLALTAASLVIWGLPFRIVVLCAQRRISGSPAPIERRRAVCKRVRWAVTACVRRLPWHPVCLPQGLAVQWILRRRNIPSVLYYGAAPAPAAAKGLAAHVWVCADGVPVIGGEAAQGMAVLARFSSSGSACGAPSPNDPCA